MSTMPLLGIFAHPDDEIIFGWAMFNEPCHILNISDNHNTYGKGPYQALQEVCRANESTCETVGLPNEFYRLPTRYDKFTLTDAIDEINKAITEAIKRTGSTTIFTHNQWGEYGHGDHRLVHDIVIRHPDIEYILTTDICQKVNCHLSTEKPPKRIIMGSPTQLHCKLDSGWFNRMKQIYEKHNAWSWGGHDIVSSCNLYSI